MNALNINALINEMVDKGGMEWERVDDDSVERVRQIVERGFYKFDRVSNNPDGTLTLYVKDDMGREASVLIKYIVEKQEKPTLRSVKTEIASTTPRGLLRAEFSQHAKFKPKDAKDKVDDHWNLEFLDRAADRGSTTIDHMYRMDDGYLVFLNDQQGAPSAIINVPLLSNTGGGKKNETRSDAVKDDIKREFTRSGPEELAEDQKRYDDLVAKWKDRADRITERDKDDLRGVLKEQVRDALLLDPEFLKLFEIDTAGNIRFDDSGMPMFKKGGDVTDILMHTHWGIAESFAREIGIVDEEEIKQFCRFIMFD